MAHKNTHIAVRGSTVPAVSAELTPNSSLVLGAASKEHCLDLQSMLDGIEEEYDCKTASEYALAELAAGSYVRSLEASRELIDARAGVTNLFCLVEKTGYCKMLSKEIDRANRQFTSAILTLKQLKAPSMTLNVKAKNAFIAENQQFNMSADPNRQNENNDRQ